MKNRIVSCALLLVLGGCAGATGGGGGGDNVEDAGMIGDGGCHPRHTVADVEIFPCADGLKIDICNKYGLLNSAICYPSGAGPNPLPDIASSLFPAYGCIAPADSNLSNGAGEWAWWCCSKIFPGPLVCD